MINIMLVPVNCTLKIDFWGDSLMVLVIKAW